MVKQFGFSAVALTTALLALSGCREEGMRGRGERVTPVVSNPHMGSEQKMNLMAEQLDAITVKNVHDTLGGKNPARLSTKSVFAMADFLYWQAHVDNLEFGYEYEPATGGNSGELLNMNFKWDAGFRLGLGYTFGCHDQWDFRVNWTWFHDRAHGSESSSDFTREIIFPTWYQPILGRIASEASAHWHLHYNTVDFDLGRDYFISKAIAFRPYMGLRGAWINQHYRAKYTGFVSGLGVNSEFEAKNDYHAGGLRAGTDMTLSFTGNWGLVGKVAGALMYGHFDVDADVEANYSNGTSMLIDQSHDYMRVRPNVEGALGLMYESDLFNQAHHISFAVLYELNYWFNQNQLYKTNLQATDATSIGTSTSLDTHPQNGDLSMQGVTFKFQYNF